MKKISFSNRFRILSHVLSIREFRLYSSNTSSYDYFLDNFFLFLINSSVDEPSWRPRFRFYHWLLSLLGVIVCISIMLISSWYIALIALVIGAIVYIYIWYARANKEWVEGLKGLPISIAHVALSHLDDRPMHTKNFRPQILVFLECNYNEDQHRWLIEHEKILDLLSQLKAGKGLIILSTIIKGKYDEKKRNRRAIERIFKRTNDHT